MRLIWLIIFIVSHIAHSLALEVIYLPNDYTRAIEVYNYNQGDEIESDCNCHDYLPFDYELIED